MRYQSGLKVVDIFPEVKGKCGKCGAELTGRRTRWCSNECQSAAVTEFLIQRGDVPTIRRELRKRDNDICAACKQKADAWEADHIVAVVNGGGKCGLDGFQTLCVSCHKKKTMIDLTRSGK